MPVFIIILAILGVFGVLTGAGQPDYAPSDVILSTPTGGLVRNDAQGSGGSSQSQITVSPTSVTPEPVPEPVPEPEPEIITPPTLDTLAAQDIDTDRATLRGSVEFSGAPQNGNVSFIYSKTESDVINKADAAEQIWVSSSGSNGLFRRTITRLEDDTTYYYRICFDAEDENCGDVESVTTDLDFDRNDTFRLPSASTRAAEDINADAATLVGKYTIYDEAEYVAFFVYGEDKSLIRGVASEYTEYDDVRESGDDLQKIRAGVNLVSSQDVEREIEDLENSLSYYYAFCVSYDSDEAAGIRCGSTVTFITKDRNRDNPRIQSSQVQVNSDTAQMSATVSMQDYLDGHVFLVYGTDEDRIIAVEEFDTFDRIRQSGDELQRISLDIDHDGSDDFSHTARDLMSSNYHYRFCVEYEAEDDRGRDDLFLECGTVESFQIQ